ncbi:BA75_04315T0 [Komagataella pastoris]|uniref:BA75_04315T0 n=1 Tax=Komagataella pastoris TaxID=4922 RepID=A0A1B2JG83_PICPA|nr:BA75_04315T0 [Komagataella pastoris]
MSLEPPTSDKVVLTTTKGPITLCLWTKEVPIITDRVMKALCKGLVFQPIVPKELIQLSLPIDEKLSLEAHSRLKFNQRGIIGFNHTTNELFFTVKPMPEFNHKFTVVGKCGDDTIFTVIDINESELAPGTNGIALYPTKIDEVTCFGDFPSGVQKRPTPTKTNEPEKKKKRKVVLDLFEEDDTVVDPNQFRLKSAHDTLQDKTLSKEKVKIEDKHSEKKQNVIRNHDQPAAAAVPNQTSENASVEKTLEQIEELKAHLRQKPHSVKPLTEPTESSSKTIKELKTLELLKKFKQKLSDGSLNPKFATHKLNFKDNPANALSVNDDEVVVVESRSTSDDSKH